MRYLDRIQPLALLVLRVVLGAIMIGHGYHKVNGHMHEFANFVGSLHMPPFLGYVVAVVEFFGGMLVIVGLLTRCAAFAIFIDMSVAILKVHLPHGLLGQGGYEFPLTLWAIAFALIFLGAGPIAIDGVLGRGSSTRSKSA